MAGDPHPVIEITGITTTADVSKAAFIAFVKGRCILTMEDVAEIRATDLSGQLLIALKATGRIYMLDTGDTTTSDDGVNCIRDANGLAFILQEIEGVDGEDGVDAQYYFQGTAPASASNGEIWIDSDSADLDVYLRAAGVWVDTGVNLRGLTGFDGATIFVQNSAPSTGEPEGSLWIDSGSLTYDLYQLTGSPLDWVDTTLNLKGEQGDPFEFYAVVATFALRNTADGAPTNALVLVEADETHGGVAWVYAKLSEGSPTEWSAGFAFQGASGGDSALSAATMFVAASL